MPFPAAPTAPAALAVTPLALARRLIDMGIAEIAGDIDNPHILAYLELTMREQGILRLPALHDEIAWCSAGANYVCSLLDLPRARSVRARDWLKPGVGAPVELAVARPGFDVVVLNRGGDPDPRILEGPGHVGFYVGRETDGRILLVGGNQGNTWSLRPFSPRELLGVRRLWEAA